MTSASPLESSLLSSRCGNRAPVEATLWEMFDEAARKRPTAVAVAAGSRSVTFAELQAMSQSAAAGLVAADVKSGDMIGVYGRKSAELIATILGLWRCGAVYVPLDPKYPSQRLNAIVSAVQPKLIVCDDGPPPQGNAAAPRFLRAAELCGDHHPAPDHEPRLAALDERAVVLYTSGSTGTPKGAVLTHRNLANHNQYAVRTYHLRPGDRRTAVCSINFDASLEEFFCTLTAGATLVLPDDAALDSFERMLKFLTQERITALFLPTSLWRELTNYLYDSRLEFPETLRLIDVGGERVTRPIYDRFLKVGGARIRWVNVYGPTECSIYATIYEHDPEIDALTTDEPPIGWPIDNVELYVVDESGRLVEPGEPGELLIGGVGVGEGYLNRPDLTTERYVDAPSDDLPPGRYYRTGDQVRFRADGNLEFIGRLDNQVKLRGFRIEPGEIESTLLRHPAVRDAAVVVRTSSLNTEYLAAYVVLRPGASWDELSLREFMAERLPDYMVPRALVQLDMLPLTPNGKIARDALPEPFVAESVAAREPTALERRIRDAWCEALHLDHLDLDDDFFDLGGNSLKAMALVAKLEAVLNRPVSAATLYQAPSIARLAAAIAAPTDDRSSPLVPLRDGDRSRPLFFIHPLAGDVWLYRELARHLRTPAAAYGLQLTENDEAAELDDVVHCAATYVARLREVQLVGPYRLAGYSSGGMVAFEMARQFAALGERVEFLGFLDAGVPPLVEARITGTLVGRLRAVVRNLPYFAADVRTQGLAATRRRIARLLNRGRRRIADLFRRQATSNGTLSDTQFLNCFAEDLSFFSDRRLKQIKRHSDSVFRYEPGRYAGAAHLFRVRRQPLTSVPTPGLGWEAVLDGPLAIHEVPGTHDSVVRSPHVEQLAAAIDAALQDSAIA